MDEALKQFVNQVSPLAIAVLVPMIVAGFKKLMPNIPSWLLPVSAPFVGALGDFIVTVISGWSPAGGTLPALLAGALGVFVRESFDQVKKALPPGTGTIKAIAPFLLVALFALGGPTGCAGMGAMAVPQTPAQQIAYAKATHTGLVNMTATLTETGKLTWVDAIGVREKLRTADATLALARSMVKQGIPADGLAQLEMAQKLLIELNNYLLSQEGDKP